MPTFWASLRALTLLFRRMVLFRLDSSGLVAPLPVSLVADVILGGDGVYAILFALFDNSPPLVFAETGFDFGNRHC